MKNDSFLPDFCNPDVFLRVLLVIELMSIVFALVSFDRGSLYVHIALISVLMQWIGLSIAAALCGITRIGLLPSITGTTLLAFVVTLVITALVTLLNFSIEPILSNSANARGLGFLMFRNLTVASILIGLALRYFYLQYETRVILEIQAQARLQALQARIRPHFLFNSMNTIASLTHDEPDLAEQAIENLSDLFRASLAAEASITLQQELELTQSYIQLEALRLGDRLRVNWTLPKDKLVALLPALTMQPLVENAIYHGVEPLAQGGQVDIVIKHDQGYIEITISNPLPADQRAKHREGNKMAVDNIKERLQITFSGEASLYQQEANERFTVTIKFPVRVVEVKP